MGVMRIALSMTNRIGVLDLYAFTRRKLSGSQLAIVTYHRVCLKNDNWSLVPLSPQAFKQQIEYFCRHYEIITLDEVVRYLQQGKIPPKKAIAITFDDGYSDNFLYAYPILIQYHVPATIFLTTGHISSDNLFWWDKVSYILQNTGETQIQLEELGNYSLAFAKDKLLSKTRITEALKRVTDTKKNNLIQKMMTLAKVNIPGGIAKILILSWDEIKEMSANGISFGAHTVNHPILTNISLEQAYQEILESKLEIEKRLDKKVISFSYPNGSYNNKIVELVKDIGFSCAVSGTPNKLLNIKDDISALGRIPYSEDMSILKLELSGVLGDLQLLSKRTNFR